ncbi:hypothetical protein CPB84DRAFT_1891285 [Gymnopilus junonius]|uniref:DUF6697 domain-containing protein n=1 Tax=Gymnopilus junonius TaxID=109634 RepID=A0A9P5NUM3_GYMJU|nr:hypothetical protein CPB84DRAFT_1891285 [Gymnopilus junonius]
MVATCNKLFQKSHQSTWLARSQRLHVSQTRFQQLAPQFPGNPGLFINPNADVRWPGRHRVFVRLKSGEWQYIGFYEITPSISLSRKNGLILTLL